MKNKMVGTCKKCGEVIVRVGTIWHDNGLILPSQCQKNDNTELHEPEQREGMIKS